MSFSGKVLFSILISYVALYNPINGEDGTLKAVSISKKGMSINPSPGPNGRGNLIEILFYSENDMYWKLSFHFHKGDTFIKTNIVEIPEEETNLLRHETIWRD